MKKIICLLVGLVSCFPVIAQQGKDGAGVVNAGGTIVNSYTTLSADAAVNATTISVASVASLNAGDLIMIIQMQGASVNVIGTAPPFFDPNSGGPGDTTYGRITAYNGAGNNEFAEINSISGTTLTLNCGLKYGYLIAGKTQIVKVPRYTSLTIGAAGVITCPHWDRTLGYGGIIAIEVHGNTTIAAGGRIDATGLGFRGGALWNKTASAAGGGQWGTLYRNEGGNKGESIAGDTNVYAGWSSKFGKGSIANGGGGGNSINAGGGGGANAGVTGQWLSTGNPDNFNTVYTTCWNLEYAGFATSTSSGGGRGGYTFSNDNDDPRTGGINNGNWGTSDNRRVQGGLGGRPLDYSTGSLFLGGGGGTGDHENGFGGAAGDGGGIIYILSYGTVSGSGQIISNGAAGGNTNTTMNAPNNVRGREGASGAGGGGAIVVNSTGPVAGISVSANGGTGGNNNMQNQMITNARMAYGPGGGGGGGYIGMSSGSTAVLSVAGGNNGIVDYIGTNYNCQIVDLFPPNGATRGGVGTTSTGITNFSITTTGATICSGNTAVLTAALNGTAPNPVTINWYAAATGGSPIATGTSYTTTTLTATTTFYVGTCPGIYREPVTVTITPAPAAPTATSPVSYCLNAAAAQLTATAAGGNTLLWWGTSSSGGTSSATAPTPVTSAVGSTTYYVSQSNGSCEGPRQAITVDIINLPNQPTATSPITYCENEAASQLTATAGGGNTLLWWGTSSSGGTSSATAPTPVTTSAGSTTYYVSETNGTCESPRTPVTVTVTALPSPPTVNDTISYCQNEAATPLTPGGAGINWYTSATGGSATGAPTPNTSAVGVTTYYVSQTQGTCESNRDSIKVVVNTSFLPPTVSNVAYCLGATAADLSANASGTATLNWYGINATGGTASATAPTPSTSTVGTVSYYVSQGSANCESNRSQIDVVVNAIPNQPSVTTPVTYCENETASQLTAIAASGNSLLWWGTSSSGGTSSATAPTPVTTPAGSATYYVSETNGTCESPRTPVTVTVTALPSPPTVNDTISYCQNEVATALTPGGAGINWYTSATGGSATGAPTPNTSAVGVTTYYVSQTQGTCESNRDSIKVVVNTSFLPPSVSNIAYCLGATAADLSANASGTSTLNWYGINATGGTASATAPTPPTSAAGTVSYYVSQGSANCESNRSQIDVTINPIPASPVGTDVTYCLNEPPVALSATGSGTLGWYTVSVGGTANATAPTPLTSSVGVTDYYVAQTDANGCESVRDTVRVSVINLQNPPLASNVSYCAGASASVLTATGTSSLNWWGTAPTGGTSSATAPLPSTSVAGVTNYYVSQGTGACESPRTQIIVTVSAKPNISFTQNLTTICANNCIQFSENASAGCTSLIWNFGDGNTSTSSAPSHCYTTAGVYPVKVICTNAQGCTDSSLVAAAVNVTSGANAQISLNPGTTVSPGTLVTFMADTGSAQIAYNWNFADLASGAANTSTQYNPGHIYNEEGIYCVSLVAGTLPCIDTAEVCIEVIKDATISIPNIITPNGDGLNELFSVTSSGLKTLEGSIYDRWGVKLYSWSGITGSWDGKGKGGKIVSNGVYYYIINTTDFKSEEKKYSGYVQVIGIE